MRNSRLYNSPKGPFCQCLTDGRSREQVLDPADAGVAGVRGHEAIWDQASETRASHRVSEFSTHLALCGKKMIPKRL